MRREHRQIGEIIMNTIKIDHKGVLMVAHRGCSGLEKENTHAAFVAAGTRSYYGIETDVHVTLDGKFVCFHDDNTKRVALDNMVVEESTFDTLRALILTDKDDVKGRTDLRIPTLQEYIRICKKYEKVAVLELKNAFTPEDIRKIVDIIVAEEYLENVTFISFCLDNMLCLRKMLPEQPLQFLISTFTDELVDILVNNHLDLDIRYTALTAENIALLKSKGIKVNCWTVDDPAAAEQLIEWGVDFITSNILE